jgi:hypothetical protein
MLSHVLENLGNFQLTQIQEIKALSLSLFSAKERWASLVFVNRLPRAF